MNNLASLLQPLVVCATPQTHSGCHWSDLVLLANNLIQDLIVISTVLATISFIFAGFKLITSQGNPSAMNDAKDTLFKVLIGYVIILAAWIVVYTISKVLLNSGYSILGPTS